MMSMRETIPAWLQMRELRDRADPFLVAEVASTCARRERRLVPSLASFPTELLGPMFFRMN
jgi:hypothetical protein